MSTPFNTSLRRHPGDPRGLVEQIDALVKERLEEAVEFGCLDLLVQSRRVHRRPAPEKDSEKDRQEFQALVRELLIYLRGELREGLTPEDLQKISQAEDAQGGQELPRLLAGQTALARMLPDYWQRFETLKTAFTRARLSPPPPRPSLLDRLFRRARPE